MNRGGADASGERLSHVAIRASAGTGKTYQLTNRFLRLMAEGEAPERILAVTFTRKAAGEIFERIAGRLAGAARDEGAARRLAQEVGANRAVGAASWGAMLVGLLRSAHRLNVGTLDSVFVRIAQAFALELNLPPSWSIGSGLQETQLRERALAASLEAHDPQALIDAVRLLNRDESPASVAGEIERTVERLHTIYLDAPERAAWYWLGGEVEGTLLSEPALAGAIGELREAVVEDDKRLANAKKADVERAVARDWAGFVSKGLAKAIQADGLYYKKPIPTALVRLYEPLIAHARAQELKKLDDENRAAHELVARFDEQYHAMQRAKRMLRFEDITRQLALAQLTERWAGLLYRLDARFDHLLLDEFQDTSREQWRVIRPLAREITAQEPDERSLFCVGDVKQSIYGWRGGEPAIFRGLEGQLPSGIEVGALSLNRRSGPDVIQTVNAVFENVEANPAVKRFADAAANWAAGFERHEAHRSTLPGYCELAVADVPAGTEGRPKLLQQAAERVAELRGQPGVGSVAVLTRKNSTVARLIGELRRLGVAASQEGGNPLTDSPAVSVVLSLLQLADHPSDNAAAFHVSRSPLGPIVGLEPDAPREHVRQLAAAIRGRLVHEGYGPCVERWARALTGCCGPRNARRLEQLAGLAWAYDEAATLRPSDFVRHVEHEQVEEPSAAAVRVMTVHKAKGLQFDAVVLPELDKPMVGTAPEVLVDRPDPTGEVERVSQPGRSGTRELSPTLQRMFSQYQQRATNDALSTLYVALTRAVHGLYMLIPPCKENAKSMPATFAGFVWSALVGEAPPKAPAVGYAVGDPHWWKTVEGGDAAGEAGAAHEPEDRSLPARIELAAEGARKRMLPRQTPSRLEDGGRVDVAGLLRPGRRAAVDRGTIVHAWFEQIVWIEDGEPDDETLRAVAAREAPGYADVSGLIEQFRRMLAVEAVRGALSRRRYEAVADAEVELSVEAEMGFAVRDGERLLEGKFDRMVIVRQSGRPARAEVLDFKTDADEPAHIIARYRPQLEAYRRAAATMLGLAPESVDTTLVMVGHGEVASV